MELEQLHKDLSEVKQQLARVLVLLELAVALEPRVRDLESQNAALTAKVESAEKASKEVCAEWNSFKMKALGIILGGGLLAGGAGSSLVERLFSPTPPQQVILQTPNTTQQP